MPKLAQLPVFFFCLLPLASSASLEDSSTNYANPHLMLAQSRPLPYPAHPDFGSFRWTSEPHKYPGTGSDMHWWAWRSDGALIVVDEDGRNFDGPWCFGHVLEVTGAPPNHTVREIAVLDKLGIKDGVEPGPHYTAAVDAKGYSRYVGAALVVGKRIYISVYDYDWSLPELRVEIKDIYSAHRGVVGFVSSDDEGLTWTKHYEENQPLLLGPRFAALQFIHFGPGSSNTPEHLDGWLYAVSNDSNWESGDNLFLARVRPDAPHKRDSWEFFAGFPPGASPLHPSWTKDEALARPIFTDPGFVGHSAVSWNPYRNAYWLAVFSDTVPHKKDTDYIVAHATWDVATQLQLYESQHPWGPWALLHHETPWGGPNHAAYLPMLPTPWMDPDGNGGVLLFTGDWAKHKNAWYGFMTQRFRVGNNR